MSGVGDYFNVVPNLQATVIKFLAGLGLFLAIVVGVYLMGRHDGKQAALSAFKTVAQHVAETRADNAIDAAQRLGNYTNEDRALTVGIADALAQVHQYYKDHPEVEVQTVTVPGKKEVKYVTNPKCPATYLSPDELQLYNMGNERDAFDLSDPKAVP